MGSLWAKWDVMLLANKKQVYLLNIYTEQNLQRNFSYAFKVNAELNMSAL